MLKDIFNEKVGFIVLDAGISLFIALALIFIINKFLTKIFKGLELKAQSTEIKKQINTIKIVTISSIDTILYAFLILHILDIFGIDLKPIIATAGVMGLAVGFAGKKFVEDLISGLLLLLEEQIRVGDIVKIQNTIGTVEKVNLRLVILRDIEGTVHYFRNSMIDTVSNYSKNFSYAVFDIGIAYKENISHVIDIIKTTGNQFREIEEYKDIITSDIEILGLDKFDDSAVIIKFRIQTLPSHQWTIQRAFNLMLKNKFDEQNIEIPFPQRVVEIKK